MNGTSDSGKQAPLITTTAVVPAVVTIGLLLLVAFDTHFMRAYRAIDWPHWTYIFEDFLSNGGYWLFLFIGAVLLAIPRPGRGLVEAVGGFAIQFALVHALKPLFGRVRLCHGGEAWLFTGPSAIHSSFPSGHAAAAWTMAFLLTRRYPRAWPLWWTGAGLISWARLHADAHFLSDVAAGIVLGWTVEKLVHALTRPRPESKGEDRREVARLGEFVRPLAHGLVPLIIVGGLGVLRSPAVPEFTEPEARELVARMYRQVFRREADPPGLEVFTNQLARDSLAIGIMREMAVSPEFVNQLRPLLPNARTTRMYHRLLGRDPMPEERAAALALLEVPASDLQFAVRTLSLRLLISREYLERYGCFAIPNGDPPG